MNRPSTDSQILFFELEIPMKTSPIVVVGERAAGKTTAATMIACALGPMTTWGEFATMKQIDSIQRTGVRVVVDGPRDARQLASLRKAGAIVVHVVEKRGPINGGMMDDLVLINTGSLEKLKCSVEGILPAFRGSKYLH